MSIMAAAVRAPVWRPMAARMPTRNPVLRRECACGQHSPGGGECQSCAEKRIASRMANTAGGEELAPPIVHDVLRARGEALDKGTRQFLEPRFGQDFSGVRVHAGSRAAEAARAVNARAFTVGQSIVLGAGQSPTTASGLRLVAHELAHTVQQAEAPRSEKPIEIGRTDHPAEREAEQLSRAALKGETETPAQAADNAKQLRRDDKDQPEPKPLIPAPKPLRPLIDSIDPKVVTPLGGGSLEDAHKAWNKIFGGGQSGARGGGGACPSVPGIVAGKGDFAGQCCHGSVQSETSCCPPIRMNQMGVCCGKDEAPKGVQCVKMEQGPTLPEQKLPPLPQPLLPKLPPIPKGPLQDLPDRTLPPGQAYA
jgi:hypothetical protein